MNVESTINKCLKRDQHLCPFGRIRHIDNWLRPLIHNPKTLFEPYVKPGMTVLDVGCGGGFVSMAMARFVGEKGQVIAADIQQVMLDHVANRAVEEGLSGIIQLHRCTEEGIGVTEDLDFAVGLFMVHEVPDQEGFFTELSDRIKPGGRFFMAEPLFHVSREKFEQEIELGLSMGFEVEARPRVAGARGVVLRRV